VVGAGTIILSPAHTDTLTARNKLLFPLSGKNHYWSRTEELQQDELSVQPQIIPQWRDTAFSSSNGTVDLHLPSTREMRHSLQREDPGLKFVLY